MSLDKFGNYVDPSPGLDMTHGFLRQIQNRQLKRKEQDQCNNNLNKVTLKQVNGVRTGPQTKRPTLESYKPPAGRMANAGNRNQNGLDMGKVDIGNYIPEAQQYILKALKDPSEVTSFYLTKVAECIVNRAYEDRGYYKTAAKMCQVISQKEKQSESLAMIPCYPFRVGIVNTIHTLYEQRHEMYDASTTYWIEFTQFVAEIYAQVKVMEQGLSGIYNILFNILTDLTKQPHIDNPEEVDLMCTILHEYGKDLERDSPQQMKKLLECIRDAFLEPYTDVEVRKTLLQILEMKNGCWQLPETAAHFYYGGDNGFI